MGVNKVLILFAILTMVSAAQGGIIWLEVDGVDPNATTGNYDVDLLSDITMIIVADTGILSVDTDILGPGTAKAPISSHALFTGALGSDGVIQNNGTELITLISIACVPDFIPVPAGETLYSFTYTVPNAPGTTIDITGDNVFVQFRDFDFTQTTSLGAATLNIVPEPMTIALLGLGGLFLRRRYS